MAFPSAPENDSVASIGVNPGYPPPVTEAVRGKVTFLEGFDFRVCRDIDLNHFQ
jgi:hypothetical protein